jgi:hypothetical protein
MKRLGWLFCGLVCIGGGLLLVLAAYEKACPTSP